MQSFEERGLKKISLNNVFRIFTKYISHIFRLPSISDIGRNGSLSPNVVCLIFFAALVAKGTTI